MILDKRRQQMQDIRQKMRDINTHDVDINGAEVGSLYFYLKTPAVILFLSFSEGYLFFSSCFGTQPNWLVQNSYKSHCNVNLIKAFKKVIQQNILKIL